MLKLKEFLVNITLLAYACFFSLLSMLSMHCYADDSGALPNLGSSYSLAVSPREEAVMGKILLQTLYQYDAITNDHLINNYISKLGKKLAFYAPAKTQHYNFFAIQDYTINAFAFFDGNVGVHLGAILAAESESELAAVMAHEIAHVAQKHLLRHMDENKRLVPFTILGVVASVAVGMPDLAMASMAQHQQSVINYTREFEKEADRIGITILANAGFNPQDMANIFYRMQSNARYQDKPPEYLVTHPLYENRIADARGRADNYPYKQSFSSQTFYLVKAKVKVAAANDVKKLIHQLKQNIAAKKFNNPLEINYTLALAYAANKQYTEAEQTVKPLLAQNKDNLFLQLLLADIYRETNQKDKCLNVLNSIYSVYPENSAVQLKLADALLSTTKPNKAKQAEKILLDYNNNNESLEGYDLLVRAESMLNNTLQTHIYKTKWYMLRGEMRQAERQLAVALEFSQKDAYAEQTIMSLQQEIQKTKEDQRNI